MYIIAYYAYIFFAILLILIFPDTNIKKLTKHEMMHKTSVHHHLKSGQIFLKIKLLILKI